MGSNIHKLQFMHFSYERPWYKNHSLHIIARHNHLIKISYSWVRSQPEKVQYENWWDPGIKPTNVWDCSGQQRYVYECQWCLLPHGLCHYAKNNVFFKCDNRSKWGESQGKCILILSKYLPWIFFLPDIVFFPPRSLERRKANTRRKKDPGKSIEHFYFMRFLWDGKTYLCMCMIRSYGDLEKWRACCWTKYI